jgi:hypothetical protein
VRYIGKTCITTQNVLAICDFDMRFTYVAARQLSSYHETHMYCIMLWRLMKKTSLIHHKVQFFFN